jgi:glucokinase
MREDSLVIGADIGGSHITAGLVNLSTKELLLPSLVRKNILPEVGAAELIGAWADCIAASGRNAEPKVICLAMPGPFLYDEGICLIKDQNKYPGLYGVNVKERLSAALHTSSGNIYLHNDAACFLQGEVFCGNLAGRDNLIGVTLGTGLGTAKLKNGQAGSADLWNLRFKDSIAEDYISSRWFVKRYLEETGKIITGVKEMVALAGADPLVEEIFKEFGINLGQFLNRFIALEHPEAVVIGGNIAKAFSLFKETLLEEIRRSNPFMPVHQTSHGENAALIGAVSSWYNSAKYSFIK